MGKDSSATRDKVETTSAQSHLVDWDVALETVGGDRELLTDLLRLFLDDWNSMIGEIESAIQNGDEKELRRAAHAFKGALNHLGATSTASKAFALEKMGEAGDLSDSNPALAQLQAETLRLLVEFEAFTVEAPSSNG